MYTVTDFSAGALVTNRREILDGGSAVS